MSEMSQYARCLELIIALHTIIQSTLPRGKVGVCSVYTTVDRRGKAILSRRNGRALCAGLTTTGRSDFFLKVRSRKGPGETLGRSSRQRIGHARNVPWIRLDDRSLARRLHSAGSAGANVRR
jgi:hypothetical protein